MGYQWFPGHMTKAFRMMQEDIKLIDLVIEILDARIPYSSRNPDIDKLCNGKARLIILNKSDLADPDVNNQWVKYFKSKNIECILADSKKGLGLKAVKGAVLNACKDKIERDRKKGILARPLRAMVCGIPNVGKSTFINAFVKKSAAATGNKPGITKGKQWIKLDKTLELLDTPGVLWPKFENQDVGLHIAMIGSINDEIIHEDELAADIITFVAKRYPGRITERYNVAEQDDKYEILKNIGLNKKCLVKGGEVDYGKASRLIIEDFRSAKLGCISIERTEDYDGI